MRQIMLLVALATLWLGCTPQSDKAHGPQAAADTAPKQAPPVYKPGLGEFMLGIQIHHAKLWFAGKAENWKLAAFELDEMKEALDNIRQFNNDRPEVQSLPMINAAIDSLDGAIKAPSMARFNSSFTLLTTTCNNCHRLTQHECNVIKVPDAPPFSNQDFRAHP